MTASTPMRLDDLYLDLAVENILHSDTRVEVYSPAGEYLGTVGESGIVDGVMRLYTIKYDERLVSE